VAAEVWLMVIRNARKKEEQEKAEKKKKSKKLALEAPSTAKSKDD
jgi:hypothetical protein